MYVGNDSYTVRVDGISVEVRNECNYLDATNSIYKDYKNANKSTLSLEKYVNE